MNNTIVKATQTIYLQIVDQEESFMLEQIQNDIINNPNRYSEIDKVLVLSRKRIKELLLKGQAYEKYIEANEKSLRKETGVKVCKIKLNDIGVKRNKNAKK